jgi:hypothetical protein
LGDHSYSAHQPICVQTNSTPNAVIERQRTRSVRGLFSPATASSNVDGTASASPKLSLPPRSDWLSSVPSTC